MTLDIQGSQVLSSTDVMPNHATNHTTGVPVTMRVKKRDGRLELVDVNRIVNRVASCAGGLSHIDPMFVATRTIGGLYDGASTKELDALAIQTAALQISEEPEYSQLAARLLAEFIDEEVNQQGITTFSQGIFRGQELGIINDSGDRITRNLYF